VLESIGWYSECAKKLSKHRRDIIDVILSAQRSDKEDGAISAADTSWAIVRVIVLALEGNARTRSKQEQQAESKICIFGAVLLQPSSMLADMIYLSMPARHRWCLAGTEPTESQDRSP
jgi:hypothetical protein